MEIGICTGPEMAAPLKTAGIDYLEVSVQGVLVPEADEETFEAKAAEAAKAPLPLKAANCFIPAEIRATGPDTDVMRLLAYAETAFRRAAEMGIETIVFGSGGARGLPEGFSQEEAEAQFVEVLKGLGPLAQKTGISVVVEPLRRAECNFINTVEEGADLVRRADHPHVRLLADLYHMAHNSESPQSLAEHGEVLKHIHVAEEEERAAPGVHGEDFGPYFRALAEGGYQGRISIEGDWQPDQIPHAVDVLRSQLKDAGLG